MESLISAINCPLCTGRNIISYHRDKFRDYLCCSDCGLVFVPSEYHLNTVDEKARYDLHQNNPEDEGYRRFLSRLSSPLIERLPPGQNGLDFGCGPGPTLSIMMETAGHSVALFDPYYHNNPEALNLNFDFITATEVIEHMSAPGIEFCSLFYMLKKGGTLGLMTKMVKNREAFSSWHYIQDDTHISFFSKKSFEYLAEYHNAELEFVENDVILMRKL